MLFAFVLSLFHVNAGHPAEPSEFDGAIEIEMKVVTDFAFNAILFYLVR